MRRPFSALLPVGLILLLAARSYAQEAGGAVEEVAPSPSDASHGGDSHGGDSHGVQYIECTRMVPQWTTETRTKLVTKYRTETREEVVTHYKCVPETKQVEQRYTVLTYEPRTKTVNYTVCLPEVEQVEQTYACKIPVTSMEERTYTVMVPTIETRQGMRTVCRIEPVTTYREVTCDQGHWECRTTCGGCGCQPCCCTKRVWVPNLVTKQVPCTTYRRHLEQVPCTYKVTVYQPQQRTCHMPVTTFHTEQRTRLVNVTHYNYEQRSREVTYQVCVPVEKTRVCNVTTYTRVPEERVVQRTVCVPYQEEVTYDVRVCRCVPKKVLVPVCGGCGDGC